MIRVNNKVLVGIKKAAALLLSLDHEIAAKLLTLLDDEEIRSLSGAMAALGEVDASEIERVMLDFATDMSGYVGVWGNIKSTKLFLHKTVSNEKVGPYLESAKRIGESDIWERVSSLNPQLIATALGEEQPQAVAVILTQLKPNIVAAILRLLNEEYAADVMLRMLLMRSVDREILGKLEKSLQQTFIDNFTERKEVEGYAFMANVLEYMSPDTEEKLLSLLERLDKTCAEDVKKRLFTLKDIFSLTHKDVQTIVRFADKTTLAIALKGAGVELRDFFLRSMSQRSAELLLESMDNLGVLNTQQIAIAQSSLLKVTKDLINKGMISVMKSIVQ